MNLSLASRFARRVSPTGADAVREGLRVTATPIELYAYLTTLSVAWSSLILPACLFTLGAAYLGNRIDGSGGNTLGLAIGAAPVVFCFVGAADATWRRRFAKIAYRRYVRNEFTLDERTRRLVRIATVNDGTLILQIVIAAFVSWRIW